MVNFISSIFLYIGIGLILFALLDLLMSWMSFGETDLAKKIGWKRVPILKYISSWFAPYIIGALGFGMIFLADLFK
jgi:hypothetical protein|tara:strand:+ start:279 stop:506 length:228 start_codon:yes stop_codon:yes gene_type:complete